MPDRNADQGESPELNRGVNRQDRHDFNGGSRVGESYQPKQGGMIDDESDEFEGYDQRLR